jgi:hypothetical protein
LLFAVAESSQMLVQVSLREENTRTIRAPKIIRLSLLTFFHSHTPFTIIKATNILKDTTLTVHLLKS